MKYKDIYNVFLEDTKIDKELIEDYKPCTEMYGQPNMQNSIVVWLKNGDQLIYTYNRLRRKSLNDKRYIRKISKCKI